MLVSNAYTTSFKSFSPSASLETYYCRAKRHAFFVCELCERSFASEKALTNHMNSSRHWQVGECLDSESEEEEGETSYCHRCSRHFVNPAALCRHRVYSSMHNWCFACDRDFSSANGLGQHVRSLAHANRIFKCPFCRSMFKSPSGIALHIESGCHKVTRHDVTAAVLSMKIVPNIAIKRITDGPISVPTTIQTKFIAAQASFNGESYACFLCTKECRTLAGLNSHLNSVAHDDDEFRCPKCKAEFKLISGLVQHLESRSCGLAEDEEVGMYYNDLADQFSFLLKM